MNQSPPGTILVVGAGAAGLVAAIAAAASGTRVVVVERTKDGGRKILASGGGRCNVLPSAVDPHRFATDSPPHLLRAMLRSWPIQAQRSFFERDVGIPLALEAETGKLFPASNRSRDVRDGLVALARRTGVEIVFDTMVTGLEPDGGSWSIRTSRGTSTAGAVVLATGGLSVPATGSDGRGLQIARALGVRIHEPYPALTPLVSAGTPHASLSGISTRVRLRARADGRTLDAHGGFLFTHRGYSGPAVLDVSHVAVRARRAGTAASLRVNWAQLDADAWEREIAGAGGLVATAIARRVPQRLAAALMEESGVPVDRRSAELRRDERVALLERLTSYALPVTGDEGYAKAEVTGGGVALDEVDPRTLECRAYPGLFLCGEMLDAFGPIGGHNFAWAFATGRAAGRGAARACRPNGA